MFSKFKIHTKIFGKSRPIMGVKYVSVTPFQKGSIFKVVNLIYLLRINGYHYLESTLKSNHNQRDQA